MSRVFRAINKNSLVHTAIENAGGLKVVADHLGLSAPTVAKWVENDRVPGRHILKVCHLGDVEPLALIEYVERKKKPWFFKHSAKKHNSLDTLVDLYRGETTIGKAYMSTGISPRTLKQMLTIWGDRVVLLRDTLTNDGLSNAVKAERLNISERQLRRLQTTYLVSRPKEDKPYKVARQRAQAKWKLYKAQTVRIVVGEMTIVDAADKVGLSVRQMHRWLEKELFQRFSLTLQEIRPLPRPFRYALGEEIEHEHPEVASHLIDFWRKNALKERKMPETPAKWKNQPLRRCLIGLFMGEVDVRTLADAKETMPSMLYPILTANLIQMRVSYEQARMWSVHHQECLALILNSLEK